MYEIDKILEKVYLRLHNFFYRECGFMFPAQDGITPNSTFHPNKRMNVLKGIGINNIKHAKSIIVGYKAVNVQGGRIIVGMMGSNKIFGYTTKSVGLPVFHIFLRHKDSNGKSIQRMIIPQNALRDSNTAAQARRGEHISWVLDPSNDADLKRIWIARCTGKTNIEFF